MSATKTCPQCSKPLPAGAPEGLCPECLVKVGIGSEFAGGAGTPTVKGPPPPLAIDNIARHFPQLEILEQLGQGGMGVVYKARQRELDRLVALKVLPPDIGRDAAFVERFQREARALARLNHPNIVAVYDFGTTAPLTPSLSPHPMRGEGRGEGIQPETSNPKLETSAASLCYFIMEFVDGANLRQLQQTKKLAPQEALAIVPKVCEALQFAHDEGIVHRDIKPENILVDKKGRVKIADFGLAKLLGKSAPDFALTGPQTVMGTPHYMAPEQIQGTRDVDHRADIYSLGVVFYEMLTGELPLGRFAPPSQKVQVDVRLDEVVLKTLEQEPGRRYQHASEVKTQVENISGMVASLPPQLRHAFGFEFKSKTEWFGLPLVHIVSGVDLATGKLRVAKGVLAIGNVAKGVVAFGGAAYGGIAFGGLAVGLVTIAGCGIGLVSFAGLAIALLGAYGGLAVAPIAIGGLAVGHYAFGGGAFGAHAAGGNANDPAARQFFAWVMPNWKYVNIGGLVLMAVSFIVPFFATFWARRHAAAADAQLNGDPTGAPAPIAQPDGIGRLSLGLALGGIVLPIGLLLVALAAAPREHQSGMLILCVVLGALLELAAFGCGVVGRRSVAGKAGLVVSGIVLATGLLLLPSIIISPNDVRSPREPAAITGGQRAAGSVTYLEGHTSIVKAVAVSPDGRTLASAGLDGRLLVRELPGGKLVNTIMAPVDGKGGGPAGLMSVAISPDNEQVFASGNRLLQARLRTDQTARQIASANGSITRITPYDGGRKLAYLGGGGSEMVLFDLGAQRQLKTAPIFPGKFFGNVRTAAASPDGQFIAVTSSDMKTDAGGGATSAEPCKLTVFDTAGVERLSWQFADYPDFSFAMVAFPDTRSLALCLPSGRMLRWALDAGGNWQADPAAVRIAPGRYTAAAASRDGKIIWLAEGNQITGIDSVSGKGVAFIELKIGEKKGNFSSFPIEQIAVTKDPLTIAAALWDGRVALAECWPLSSAAGNPDSAPTPAARPNPVAALISGLFSTPPEIRMDKVSIPATTTPGRRDFAFTFNAPPNHVLNAWLEFWKDGKVKSVPEFAWGYAPVRGDAIRADLLLTTQDGDMAGVGSAGQMRFDWALTRNARSESLRRTSTAS